MSQVPLIQPHTVILMAICVILVFFCGIAPRIFAAKPGIAPVSWQKVVTSTVLAICILYSLGQMDLAGVKATKLRDATKWNNDFRDGVLMTMKGISPNTMLISFAVILLLAQALLPIKTEKVAPSHNHL